MYYLSKNVFLFHSLLSGVIQLIFSSSIETLLSPGISPDTLHGCQELCRVRLCVLHTTDHITDQLSIGLRNTLLRSIF